MRESDCELTAFSIGENLFQFKVLPFGVKNSPATFQRLVEKVLKTRGCLGRICHVKMDDIIIPSDSIEEMLGRVREVLQCLRKAGLTASLEKSQFLFTETDFWGMVSQIVDS